MLVETCGAGSSVLASSALVVTVGVLWASAQPVAAQASVTKQRRARTVEGQRTSMRTMIECETKRLELSYAFDDGCAKHLASKHGLDAGRA